jgi:hypothetical protein
MAEAIGIKGVRIEDPAEVQEMLAEALAHPGPVLIDAVVNRMELAMPPKSNCGDGEGLHALHAEGRSQWPCRRDRRVRPIESAEVTQRVLGCRMANRMHEMSLTDLMQTLGQAQQGSIAYNEAYAKYSRR